MVQDCFHLFTGFKMLLDDRFGGWTCLSRDRQYQKSWKSFNAGPKNKFTPQFFICTTEQPFIISVLVPDHSFNSHVQMRGCPTVDPVKIVPLWCIPPDLQTGHHPLMELRRRNYLPKQDEMCFVRKYQPLLTIWAYRSAVKCSLEFVPVSYTHLDVYKRQI